MTLCPIAIAVGCRKCPIFAVCPVKGIIGDYVKEDPAPKSATSRKAQIRGEVAPIAVHRRRTGRRPGIEEAHSARFACGNP